MTSEPTPELDPRLVRWNFGALLLDVTFFSIGMAFIDSNAVLPLLLERLGASGPLIGAFAAVRFLVFSLFQIFVGYVTHGLPRQKPPLAWVAAITRLPLLALPFFLWNANANNAARLVGLWATIIILSIWALGDGLGYVPWMEIVARTFSARTRGRFFASSQLLSGLSSIGIAAFIVRGVLAAPRLPFPRNYALLTGIAALMFQVSLSGVLLLREPPPPRTPIELLPPLRDYFRRLPDVLRANPIFARLALIQLLVGFGAAASPFYVLYATAHFHLDDQWGGTYQVMQALGVVALMPAWAWLSERRGAQASIQGVAFVCLLTPLFALTVGTWSPWLFGLVFLLMGGSLGWGLWITFNHFLLAHVPEHERSLFVALFNLLFTPSALYPYLGGLLVQNRNFTSLGGMPVLFVLTSAVVAVGAVLALRLPAPKTNSLDSPPIYDVC
jgi:hypothetical protein